VILLTGRDKGAARAEKLRGLATGSIKVAVGSGLGVSFVSGLSVVKEVERGELALVRVEGLSITRRFYLACRSGRDLSPAARVFVEVMLEMFGEQGN
jgi:DNA-binding transcriptional LysR family regulator